jgi:hypothetical protein
MKTKKFLSVSLIISIFIIGSLTAAGLTKPISQTNKGEPPVPHIEGIKGDNNWYISDVLITYDYDPKVVEGIFYYIHGTWHEYNVPFLVNEDGDYDIAWYWIDEDGKRNDEWPIMIKIDRTPPTIELSKQSGVGNKVTFTADANDPVSGVSYVEFYLDDVLQETITGGNTFEWVWEGDGEHWVHAIAYNPPGFFAESDPLSTPRTHSYNINILNILIQRIIILLNLIF